MSYLPIECDCDLRDRQWNGFGRCLRCGLKYNYMETQSGLKKMVDDAIKSLDGIPDKVRLVYGRGDSAETDKTVAVIMFSKKNWGWGEITIVNNRDQMFIDDEYMGKDGVKQILNDLVDSAIFGSDREPAQHKLYNEKMKRVCGQHCQICYPHETKE